MPNKWVTNTQVNDNNDPDFIIHHNIKRLQGNAMSWKIYYVNMKKRGGATGAKIIMLMEA